MKKIEIQVIDGVPAKKCSHCGRLLPVDNFSRSKTSANGYRSWCKECVNTSRDTEENKLKCKQYYELKGRELMRSYKENDIQSYLWKSAKSRAKQRGEDFSIELEDIIVPDKCPILGIPLEYHRGVKQDNSYSLDRIDSSKGYVKGNIWVISLRANRIKNDSTPQELRLIADKVEERLLQSNNSYKEE